ncbi:MAG: winged helix-turn-helix transcriptional regulator [Streptomycetaceae bacterium]|nr:winged helix-turn-helix transcriptional regulator [Streptomycetaceae bacterium]
MSTDTTGDTADHGLAAEPVGYWTGVAHREVIAYIRGQMAAQGLTQPQYWILRYLSTHDLASNESGRTVAELADGMRSFTLYGDDLAAEADALVARGWLTRDDDGRLRITADGEAARARVKANAPAVRAVIHDGIDDAEYVAALKVLRRMIRNVGGELSPTG